MGGKELKLSTNGYRVSFGGGHKNVLEIRLQ